MAALTGIAFAVLGYHPYAEDGGIYAAAIAGKLNPALFPTDRPWVEAHTRWSLFVPAVAAALRWTHLPLAWGLLLLQVPGVFATVLAALFLARLSFCSRQTAWAATVLFAVVAGLPVAGTSLYLVDPYATARTVATPLLLFAAGLLLQRRRFAALGCWGAAAAMHPLMAVWGALPLVLLLLRMDGDRRSGWARWAPVAAGCATLGALGLLLWTSAPAGPLTRALAMTRGYWFLSGWHWYEVVGAVVPIALLWTAAWRYRAKLGWTAEGTLLAKAACGSAAIGLVAALLFAHAGGRSFAVARLQPLRTLHWFYAVFLLLLGGGLYEAGRALAGHRRQVVGCLLAGFAVAVMVVTQRSVYPASGVVEWPWRPPENRWGQAFVWVRDHTAVQDRVAVDARYTESAGEDAQGVRAIALRSALPDAAKDAGIAAVVPALEESWLAGVAAAGGLNTAADADRARRLRPAGVRWIILPAGSPTAFVCDYRNTAAKVCRLP